MPEKPDQNPWHQRFETPKLADLETLYDSEGLETLNALLTVMQERTGAEPAAEWRGIAWRWALVYRRPEEDEPWAYVIPAPGRPAVSIPVPVDPLSPSQLRQMPRFIREGIRSAPRVGQICWLETAVESATNAEDLARFIDIVTEAQPA